MRRSRLLSFLAASTATATVAVLAAQAAKAKPATPLRSVPFVDLKRYAGTWFEIARYPNRFQRNCDGDTTVDYSLRDDGKIDVVNSCRKRDGTFTMSKGTAKVVDGKTNSRLKVTFFWPFSGHYWIIGLDSDYQYAVVGEPDRKYVWILSRTPGLPPLPYEEATRIIRDAGYDPGRLLRTPQSSKGSLAA